MSRRIALLLCILLILCISYVTVHDRTILVTPPHDKDASSETKVTSISDSLLLVDSAKTFSLQVPANWKIIQESARGSLQISNTRASSPDFYSHVEQPTESPSSLVYYDTGASLYIYVSYEIVPPPYHHPSTNVEESKTMLIDEAIGEYHAFTDTSVKQGLSLDAHVNHQGKHYGLNFVYNPTTYPEGEEVFMRILQSIQFAQ